LSIPVDSLLVKLAARLTAQIHVERLLHGPKAGHTKQNFL
jgi:hypothetical protein